MGLFLTTITGLVVHRVSVNGTVTPACGVPSWTQITVGGPSDIYAFGPNQFVHRFFPNSTVQTDDYVAIDSLNSIGVTPANLPDGSSCSGSGNATLTRRCAPAYVPVTILSYTGFLELGDTRYKAKTTLDDGINDSVYGSGHSARQCEVVPWQVAHICTVLANVGLFLMSLQA